MYNDKETNDKETNDKENTTAVIIEPITDKKLTDIIKIVKDMFSNKNERIKNRKELSILIDKYLIPQELEKKSNAEISTPHHLRNEMLDKIPTDFWTSVKKVFEPCSGKGGFIMDIIDRFMDGLSCSIPDEKLRYKTIVEECLYFSDINPINIFICKLLTDPYGEYKLNFNEGDTLKLNIKEKWGLSGFDAVIGNPPYHPMSNNKKGGKSLWDDFVVYSLDALNIKGLLLYVHPALWRKPDNKMHDIMFNKQILYLKICNGVEGKKIFGAATRYEYYLMENIKPYKNSHIMFEDKLEYDDIMITPDTPFIPNFGWSIINKVVNKTLGNDNSKNNNKHKTLNVQGDSDCHTTRTHVSKTSDSVFKYKIFNSISNTKGTTYNYSSRPHKYQFHKKVLFSNGCKVIPFYDDGKLGVTQGGLYILVDTDDEGHMLVKFLKSKLIKYIIKATKWSNFETSKQIFSYIPKILDNDINDEKIYEYFELTTDEIKRIEDNVD